MYQRVILPFSGTAHLTQPHSIFSLERKEYTELIMVLQENIMAIFIPYLHINLQAFLSDRINHCLCYVRTSTQQRLIGHISGEQRSHPEWYTRTKGKVPFQSFTSTKCNLVTSITAVTHLLITGRNNIKNIQSPILSSVFLYMFPTLGNLHLLRAEKH